MALAKDAGIALTPAGSSFPYKQDPDDTNIRLAPTMPPLAEVTAAMEAVATCVLLAAAEKAAAGVGGLTPQAAAGSAPRPPRTRSA